MRLRCLILLIFVIFFSACATYKPQYKNKSESNLSSGKSKIEHSFFLIGDAGNSVDGQPTKALKLFQSELEKANKKSTAIFLGDNIYPSGLPKKEDKNRLSAEEQLNIQTGILKDFKGKTIFIPGNHDWYSDGVKGLKRQEKYIEKILGKNSFKPENGCPIEKVTISEDIVLITVDSQWYITNWDKHPNINDECEFKTRRRFIDEFESLIKKARGKTTIVAIHNPMYTNGPHGGQYSFGSHMTPLPVLGTIKNVIRKTGGIVHSDLQNSRYRELQKKLVTLAQENEKVIFVSGHEHNLQYLKEDNLHQIIAGSGSKLSPVRNVEGGEFGYASPGYARLDVYKDGSSVVKFYAVEADTAVFQKQIIKPINLKENNYPDTFPKEVVASVYPKELTEKKRSFYSTWGKRYYKSFSAKVALPTVNLDTLYGGLTPVREGGGHQSKSLRFENPQGQEFVMRALKKDASKYIQSALFKERYMVNDIKNTKTEALVLYGFTASHAFAPFTISDLAKEIEVNYTSPKLFYVPKQNAIGKFNSKYGDEIYMIEERAADGHGDKAGFEFSNQLISTYDMLEAIRKNENHMVDEAKYIRSRLFDMLIGDWDRHFDQWRWAVVKENGKTIYKPVPRDRDQAFSIMDDGWLMKFVTWLVPSVRLIRSYDSELKDPDWFNVEAFPLDVALINKSTKEIWDRETARIQNAMTEEAIDRAFLNFPEEVRDKSIDEIKAKLLGRRDNLKTISDEYFEIVNKHATVRGTDKDDWFEVVRKPNGNTLVKVFRIKNGKKKDLFFEREYKPSENKEVWLFGLDDDDYFEVKGDGKSSVKLRIIGGQNVDSYNIQNGRGVHIYDFKSKKSKFETNKGKHHLKDDYISNYYDYKKVKFDSKSFLPIIGSNPDDGFKLGLAYKYIKNSYDGEYFTAKHHLNAHVFFATGGFDFNYYGEIAEVFHNVNLGIEGRFASPNFTINFFGYGNSTVNLNKNYGDLEKQSQNYNRVKQSNYILKPSLIRKGEYGSLISLSASFESVGIDNTEERFIREYLATSKDPERDNFLGAELRYNFTNYDLAAYPTLGFNFDLLLGYKNNVDNHNSYSYFAPSLGVNYKLIPSGDLVLASQAKAHFNFGDEFEFYQAASIGGDNGLRGYRNQRFSGKTAFFQSSDLRYRIKRYRTSILPLEIGVYAGFDYGRVWVDNTLVSNSEFNKNKMNTSAGGGLFLNLADLVTGNISLFNSDDGLRFAFQFGFVF